MELRKKYDAYGEAGLKDNFDFGRQYQSWQFYQNDFGLCCELRFWREIARELEGVLNFGAVNCMDDYVLCNQEHIQQFPTLLMYPERTTYAGVTDLEQLVEFVLTQVNPKMLRLRETNFERLKSEHQLSSMPWIIDFYQDPTATLSSQSRKKLAAMLNGLAIVAYVDCATEVNLCAQFEVNSSVVYYPNSKFVSKDRQIWNSFDTKELYHMMLGRLPDIAEIQTDILEVCCFMLPSS
ncbi:unnamed protein product [Soboliphyme baturini]|uniref:Thioredoxin domain-containing protein n=1 Tax=Soboliphyme baturini TaxID=241478 RepID=A0A183J7G8_9BILA|nr:unnamed protein product [Soboliphyme baturini]